MWDVFEQPWTLLAAAVLVLFGVFTFRSVWPEKQRAWQWLLPLAVAGLAFGLDALVATDLEKIHGTINAARRAIVAENAVGVAACIAPEYNDGWHKSRADLVKHCREQLVGPTIASIRNDRSRRPAKKRTLKKTAVITPTVPRSGCARMSTAGTASSTNAGTTSRSRRSPVARARWK
jgi:hypothetical protein